MCLVKAAVQLYFIPIYYRLSWLIKRDQTNFPGPQKSLKENSGRVIPRGEEGAGRGRRGPHPRASIQTDSQFLYINF